MKLRAAVAEHLASSRQRAISAIRCAIHPRAVKHARALDKGFLLWQGSSSAAGPLGSCTGALLYHRSAPVLLTAAGAVCQMPFAIYTAAELAARSCPFLPHLFMLLALLAPRALLALPAPLALMALLAPLALLALVSKRNQYLGFESIVHGHAVA